MTVYKKLECMFGDDPDIEVEYNKADTITLRVNGSDKAEALTRLLQPEYDFGSVRLHVSVVPANREKSLDELVENALRGNPHFSQCIRIQPDGSSNRYNYMMFVNEVAQYWSDNLGDPHGNVTTLYQELAKELLGDGDRVMYCTEPD